MANMTLAIPQDLHDRMKRFSYVRWSEVARNAFIQQVVLLEKAQAIVKDSELSEKDAELLAQLVNKKASESFLNEINSNRRKHSLLSTHKKEFDARTPPRKK